jgi:glycosyltransferase involved in cell wall biosynthesis
MREILRMDKSKKREISNENACDLPKVSVITICYNSASTIKDTIESVINQTYPNVEYIIVDGGSSDGTIDIIKKYENHITKWISEPDKGISDAFNKGILMATGELIGIINSDDWYEKGAVKKVVTEHKKNNKDFYVGALRYWDKHCNSFIVQPDKKYKQKILYKMPNLNHPSSFITKRMYEEIGLFNVDLKYAMDYDLFLRAINKNKVAYIIDDVLSNMRHDGVSVRYASLAYKEVKNLAIDMGRQNSAILYYFYSLAKLNTRHFMNFLGLGRIVSIIRKVKY